MPGMHLEGPFLSPIRCGAHDPANMPEPSVEVVDRLLAAGTIAHMTLAPERPGALDVIERLVAAGVTVGIGHSDATAAEAHAAFDFGARSVTHLFNAQRPWSHRDPGIAGAALVRDDVFLTVIVDGVHLAPDAVRLAARCAGDRLVLITDAIAATGMGDGTYPLGDRTVTVHGPEARLEDGTLAGSVLTMDQAVRNLIDLGLDPVSCHRRRHHRSRRPDRPHRLTRPRERRRPRRPRRRLRSGGDLHRRLRGVVSRDLTPRPPAAVGDAFLFLPRGEVSQNLPPTAGGRRPRPPFLLGEVSQNVPPTAGERWPHPVSSPGGGGGAGRKRPDAGGGVRSDAIRLRGPGLPLRPGVASFGGGGLRPLRQPGGGRHLRREHSNRPGLCWRRRSAWHANRWNPIVARPDAPRSENRISTSGCWLCVLRV
jgi:hypothetical protein